MKLIDFFYKSKKISAKHSNYFDIYEALLKPYLNKNIVLVEIGVAAGGSLYMWKNYFEAHNKNGNQIRIIGVDIDPSVSELVEDGFEIYIGDQANPKFWSAFFSEVGKIDVLIDDGGHDNKQQIQTLVNSYSMINDGGIIIIEDIHQSLSWTVGNPHKFSFFQFLKLIETSLLEKSPGTKKTKSKWPARIAENIYAIEIFQSMTALKFDSYKAKSNYTIINQDNQTLLQKNSINATISERSLMRLKHLWRSITQYIKNYILNYSNFKFFR